ncbi:anoctamin-9 isoform X2 [Rhineura floridana]|uniref:anoctamin-9 isoform X2 n=1 Tax=Rhineura floridana TaxID=261503 RepID=UPI002AC82F51|nr:anoctamin-9 isoform X2 [Rhineura floridana]
MDEIPLMTLPLSGYHETLNSFPTKWDFVLVCDNHSLGSKKDRNKTSFLHELRSKGFVIETIKDIKLFHGICAPSWIFQNYQFLLRNPDSKSRVCYTEQLDEQQEMTTATRIRIVSFILHNTEIQSTTEKLKLRDLIKNKVFETAFPLHEEEYLSAKLDVKRENLGRFQKIHWARWTEIQPIEDIRTYFGEKVALYFAWLSWYTRTLFVAAVPGIILVIYGLISFRSSQVSKEICAANTTMMCPLCDQKCPFWPLSDTCTYAQITHLLDNEGTVLFAIFMAIWATAFLELWKRKRATVVTDWNLYQWDEEEEDLAMELAYNPELDPQLYKHSYIRSTIVLILVLLMICVLIGIAFVPVLYRSMVTVIFTQSNSEFFRERASTMAVITGAVLHYFTIIIMSKVNRRVALYLCTDLEKPRTFTEWEKNFTIKFFTFQFFNHFSSVIYVAFFLGRINGRPGDYVRVGGKWRLEECHPSGCLIDLFIQMAVIMTLKQTLNSVVEYMLPWVRCKFKLFGKPQNNSRGRGKENAWDLCKEQWLRNYHLNEVNVFSLFDEYMEMMIQYSFTTIFVAAFPLAPLLALINNLIEIRLDAFKMVRLQRRMVPSKANDIGIWLLVLEAIGILAVIGNGLVIAITSDFIPMQVYKYTSSPCMQKNYTDIDCLAGYINYSLSVFNVQDFENRKDLAELKDAMGNEITHCRYRDYRNSEDYSYTVTFWRIFAARLAFLILFEHVALCIKLIVAWFVPDVPRRVKNKHLTEKHKRLLEKSQVINGILAKCPARSQETQTRTRLEMDNSTEV